MAVFFPTEHVSESSVNAVTLKEDPYFLQFILAESANTANSLKTRIAIQHQSDNKTTPEHCKCKFNPVTPAHGIAWLTVLFDPCVLSCKDSLCLDVSILLERSPCCVRVLAMIYTQASNNLTFNWG